MAKTTNTTKTLNPLHFEDLEPHRFEDLVRQLAYDFKNWQTIEATGRSGSDDGFDIRAWEKIQEITNSDEEDEIEGKRIIDGNLWMIQCKREKEIGPSKVTSIIDDGVVKESPPYGYILAAPVNFSKKSYDAFRNELRDRGVMEFHIWGRAELEDMLSLPKNDHILFTFFGISLVTKRRSKTSEIKFIINNKNKLFRLLGSHDKVFSPILIRDSKDEEYPYQGEYDDFDKHPRWREYYVEELHPSGLRVQISERYAYIDSKKKEYDFTEAIELRQNRTEQHDQEWFELNDKIEDFWKFLPRENRAKLKRDGLLQYKDILAIDGEGDRDYSFPHIFADYHPVRGPFIGHWETFKIKNQEIVANRTYKRVQIFPKQFSAVKKLKLLKNKSLVLDDETLRLFKSGSDRIDTLYDIDGKYAFLKQRDAILVPNAEIASEQVYIQITHRYSTNVKDYLVSHQDFGIKENIERQVGKTVAESDNLEVFEFERVPGWKISTQNK